MRPGYSFQQVQVWTYKFSVLMKFLFQFFFHKIREKKIGTSTQQKMNLKITLINRKIISRYKFNQRCYKYFIILKLRYQKNVAIVRLNFSIFSFKMYAIILLKYFQLYNIYLFKKKKFRMLLFFILHSIFILIQSPINGNTSSTPTIYTTTNTIQAGIIDFSNINSVQSTYFNTYNTPFSGAMPTSALSITGMQVADPLYRYLGFKVAILNQLLNGINISYVTYNNTQFKSFKVSYFSAAAAQNFVFVDYQDFPTSNLSSGSGLRTDTYTFPNPGNTVNLKNKNYIMPFVTGLIMDKANSSNFQIAFTTYTKDTNNYDINLTTDKQTIIKKLSYYALLYDQTTTQQTKTIFIDTNYMTKPGILKLLSSNSINFLSGINSFNFDYNLGMYFNFFMNNYSLDSYSTVDFLNYSTWNLRIRQCNTTFPYYLQIQNLCYKTCPTGYITNTTYNFCQPCYYSCSTCMTGSYNGCKTCNSTWKRTLSSGQCLCSVTGYFDDGSSYMCAICDYTCYSCTGTSTNCTSCSSINYRTLSTNSCPCNSGYFDSNNAVCVLCTSVYQNCITCTSLTCLNCVQGYFVTNTNTCSACSYSCNSCNATSANCTSCLSGSYRTLVFNSCPCNSGYFDNNTVICILCSSFYQNCTSCTNTGCLACVQGYFVTNTNNCFSCSYTCYSCNVTSTNCTTCLSTNYRTLLSNSCPCNSGYFDNNTAICALCTTNYPNCLSCTINGCSTCAQGYFVSNANTCVICSYICSSCSGKSTNCTSCLSTNYRTLLSNSCPCNSGYFDNNTVICTLCSSFYLNCISCISSSCSNCIQGYFVLNFICSSCSYTCSSCSGESTNCTSCLSSNYRTLLSNSCPCNSGYFDNNTAVCTLCSSLYQNCISCTSGGCSTCAQGYFITDTNTCSACSYSCSSCSITSTNCTSCSSANYRTLLSNSCPCNSGYYDNNTTLCVICTTNYPNCLSCTINGCSTCAQRYFVTNTNNCFSCSYTCYSCNVTSTNCTTCLSTNYRTLLSNSCPCNSGYFDNNTAICALCTTNYPNCLSCTINGCSTCAQGYFVTNANTCVICSYICSSCSGTSTNCTSCLSTNHRTLLSNSCPCNQGYFDNNTAVCILCSSFYLNCISCISSSCSNCIQGYFVLNFICSSCSYTCSSCSGESTNCTSCLSSNYRTLLSNSCPCNSGYFDNNTAVCTLCSSLYQNCISCTSGGCSTCAQGYFITDTNTCSACSYSCSSCSITSTNCTSCLSINFRFFDSDSCPCNQLYFDNSSAKCVLCSSIFQKCLSCSPEKCDDCLIGYYVINNYCAICDYTCYSCTGTSTNCTSCSSINYRTLSTNSCPCNSGYFDSNNAVCVLCTSVYQNCITCTSLTCLNCVQGYFVTNTNTCSACSYSCNSCNATSANCTSCLSGSYRTLVFNSCPCNSGYFDNNTVICILCSSFYQNCTSCTNTGCLACVQGYFVTNTNNCFSCSYTCYSCNVTSTNCTTCLSTNYRTLLSNSCPCNSGYFDNNTAICALCTTNYPNCLSCTINGCSTCAQGYFVSNANTCVACSYSCNSCIRELQNCISCLQTNYRTLLSNSCPCNSGYFDNNTAICALCTTNHPNCLSCTINGCSTCAQGYFVTNANTCVICSYICSSCSGTSTNCTSCLSTNHRTLLSNSCPCNQGYFDNNTAVCILCSSFYLNCISCISSSCSNCIQGYFVLNFICSSCSYTCSSCSGESTNCTSCLSSNYRTLLSNSCPCNSGYFDNNTAVCTLCSSLYQNCISCTSGGCSTCAQGYFITDTNTCSACSYSCSSCSITSTNCTSCSSANYRTLLSNSCPCNQGYYDNNTAVCVLCASLFLKCEICSPFICLNCVSGYFPDLNSCSICDPFCYTCSDISSNCTACIFPNYQILPSCHCIQQYYFDFSSRTCILCSQSIRGCHYCSDFQICSLCQSSFLLSVTNTCVCRSDQFYNAILLQCRNCLSECLTCSDNSTCLTCDRNLYRVLNNISLCECILYYFQQNGVCMRNFTCQSQCLSCENPNTCSNCDYLINLYLINGNCTCNSSFTFNLQGKCVPISVNSTCLQDYFFNTTTGFCEEICGDGILHILECDDNNNLDGDGCSKQCKIEKFYVCSGRSPSYCSYNQQVNFSVIQTTKQLYSNTLDMRFLFSPYLTKFDSLNFSEVIIFNISDMIIIQYRTEDGQVYLTIKYDSYLQNNYVNISLKPPNNQKSFLLKSSNISYKISSNPQAVNYTTQLYNTLSTIKYLLLGGIISNYLFVFIGFVLSRTIILQTIGTVQLSVIILSFLKTTPVYLSPLTEMGPIANGYNGLFYNIPSLRIHSSTIASPRIKILGYTCEFFTDINYMVIIQMVLFLLGTIFYAISLCLIGRCYNVIITLSNFLMKQLLIGISILNSLNLGFCIGLQIMYNSQFTRLDLVPMIITICIRMLSAFIFVTRRLGFDRMKQSKQFKSTKLQQSFPIVLCCHRFILGLIIGLSNNHRQGLFGLMSLQFLFIVYMAIRGPYKKKPFIPQISIFNQFLLMALILLIIMISYTIPYNQSAYNSIFIIYMICIFLSILIALVAIIYLIKQNLFQRTNRTNLQQIYSSQSTRTTIIQPKCDKVLKLQDYVQQM